jgi:hypothetical protein
VPKRMKITVVGTDVVAYAELQEDDAPRTCEVLWEALASPIEEKVIHGMYSGPEVFMVLSPGNRNFDAKSIPRESATAYPSPGDIGWGFFPPHNERGQADEVWDIAFAYGRAVLFTSGQGIRPIGVWARITEGLDGFAEECSRIRTHCEPKTVRLERASS